MIKTWKPIRKKKSMLKHNTNLEWLKPKESPSPWNNGVGAYYLYHNLPKKDNRDALASILTSYNVHPYVECVLASIWITCIIFHGFFSNHCCLGSFLTSCGWGKTMNNRQSCPYFSFTHTHSPSRHHSLLSFPNCSFHPACHVFDPWLPFSDFSLFAKAPLDLAVCVCVSVVEPFLQFDSPDQHQIIGVGFRERVGAKTERLPVH